MPLPKKSKLLNFNVNAIIVQSLEFVTLTLDKQQYQYNVNWYEIKLVIHHLVPFKYIKTICKKIQQMAKSYPWPNPCADPMGHITGNAIETSQIEIWELSAMQLLRYEQSTRFMAKL